VVAEVLKKIDLSARERLAALKPYWDGAWADLGLSPRAGLFEEAAGRYLEPHRAYHTLRHLEECFALFAEARPLCARPGEVGLALWLHDAVYEPKLRDSEESSSQWTEKILREAAASPEVIARVRELILATKHDAAPPAGDARVLVDIDLAILGAEPARFDEYEAQVRKEYAHVPDALFRAGRAKLLKDLAARPSIYSTPRFQERFEARARENIERSLARLTR
jgi:predicted metal-dependent HD superfamily phosphohydrolase